MATPGVDFFRVDRSSRTKTLLVVAGLLVSVGATSIGGHLMHRLGASGRIVSLVGGAMLLVGLVLGFGTMAQMLFENVYLSILEEGLLVHQNGRELTIGWDDLVSVEARSDAGMVVIRPAKDGELEFFAGDQAKLVAAKIEEAKRKAAHGLLKTSSSRPPPHAGRAS